MVEARLEFGACFVDIKENDKDQPGHLCAFSGRI